MKVNAYTIEWTETTYPFEDSPFTPCKTKHIAAFDNYGAAKAKAIKLLKARTNCRHIDKQQELHFIASDGVVHNRLRVKVGRHWYQVTIKFHPSENTTDKFW